jgi:SAM-dependent methyltransferase
VEPLKKIVRRHIPQGVVDQLHSIKLRIQNKDDFEWQRYSDEYAAQQSTQGSKYTLVLPEGKYSVANGKLVLDPSILPLHPLHKLLYETIYGLKPSSILEVGCGWGDSLANIQKLLPETRISGCDLLEDQIKMLHSRHPNLRDVFVHDITTSPPKREVELVYTNAVIMHIHRDNHHLNALGNMFHVSKKYIVLMENWSSHNFYRDIMKISKAPDFPWKSLHLYKNDDGKRAGLMVISNSSLEEYEKLHGNKELLKYLRR